MRYYSLFFVFFFNFFVFSQSPAGIWYFGEKAGINFNLGTAPVSITDGEMITYEGCATLCDSYGNLLFYTDGIKVWNKNHVIMPNGNSLQGNSSSTQSAIIVPKPFENNLFYIFTVAASGGSQGLNYSVIDITLDGGNGDLIEKNTHLISPTLEKINIVKHANEIDYWLITHTHNSSEFYLYKISQAGISAPIIKNIGQLVQGNNLTTVGYMKSSPDGKYLAIANANSGVSKMQLYKFNNDIGDLTLLSTTNFSTGSNGIGVYGVEFSNDSKLLYVSNINYENLKSQIYQFEITSDNEIVINSSKFLIYEHTSDPLNNGILAAMQLAPDRKIYVARNNFSYLGVINNPDGLRNNSQFVLDGFSLGSSKSYYGLPAFITSYFNISFTNINNCYGDFTQFNIPNIPDITLVTWDFDDPSSSFNSSNLANPTHQFSGPGDYTVTLTIETPLRTSVFEKKIKILDRPIANQVTDYELCIEEVINRIQVAEFDLQSKRSEVLGVQSSNDYLVTFHLNPIDAQAGVNHLPSDYKNISNPQPIFVRIQSINSPECYDVTDFQLIVIESPELEDDIELYYCRNTYPSKIEIFSGHNNSSNNVSYSWSTGETTPDIEINQGGIYTVSVTNSNNCTSVRNINVLVSEIVEIELIVDNSNSTVFVDVSGLGNYVYSLDDINGFYQTNNYFENISTGLHLIYVKDLNGCGIASSSFSIISFPKYFSPNDDGFNDFWGVDEPEVESVRIFDRYGKLIKELKTNENWDGKFNKQNLPSTDYWFEAKLISNKIMKGHFSLKR
jgi:gliding motility-associated-like protein